jgi:hypothetical protein
MAERNLHHLTGRDPNNVKQRQTCPFRVAKRAHLYGRLGAVHRRVQLCASSCALRSCKNLDPILVAPDFKLDAQFQGF